MTSPLVQEYEELLRLHGVEHLVDRELSPDEEAALVDRVMEGAARSAAVYGDKNHLAAEMAEKLASGEPLHSGRPDYAVISESIEDALADLGFELPGPVHVGEYPHNSFNAQACRMRHGTLLLINTGLGLLLFEVALALSTVIRFIRGDGVEPANAAMLARRQTAHATLASALAAYLVHTDSTRGGKQEIDGTTRGLISAHVQRSARIFAVAHEYGHFLAGHLEQESGGAWLRKSHDQEFEADQIGALLSLRVHARMPIEDPSLLTSLAVAGPSLFLGVDHLLGRVRAEVGERPPIVSDHPPSHLRSAALRPVFTEIAGPDCFQLADSFTAALAAQEDAVIAEVHRLLGHSHT